jgi:inorganic pyrophosphatase
MDKDKINELISCQEVWIRSLNETLEELKKYRDGTRTYNERQINNIANVQIQLAQAAKNIADAIKANNGRP